MNWQRNLNSAVTFSSIVLVVAMIGCSRPEFETAEVDGLLVIKGQPGRKVHIEFIPEAGVKGPRSMANTEADGHFTLQLMQRDGSDAPGAVVGKHRVVLSDKQLSESATGRGVPIRFGSEYTLAGSTPLEQEVKPGKQTLRIEIP
jgi:hypothetical protein